MFSDMGLGTSFFLGFGDKKGEIYENCTVKDVTGYGISNSVPKYVDAPHPTTKWATYSGYKHPANVALIT